MNRMHLGGASHFQTTDGETRGRLLQVAEDLFAARGFKDVTVREICHHARANVASINYHFGDKLGLYRQVLEVAIDAMAESTALARQAGEGKPPEEQLRIYIRLFMQRLLAPGNDTVLRLINREVEEPTPVLDDLVDRGVRPRLEYLSSVVAAIMQCEVGDPRVFPCVLSVHSQSFVYAKPTSVAERLGYVCRPSPPQIDAIAEHIAEFSIAGIRAMAHKSASDT